MDDVVAIIDELEDLLLSKKKGFFSGKVYVDQDKVAELLGQLRDAVPQSFYDAMSILKQQDELIADAQRKADAVLRNANATREKLLNESDILAQAKEESDALIRSTREYCEQLKYSVTQKLDAQLYDSAVRLNESLMLIDEVRNEFRKRTNKDDR
ncbi:MAG: hypothetical protein J6Y74_04475 [Clostridia bacterium]|nr:hypothetical protein [Clostridia bacterium]